MNLLLLFYHRHLSHNEFINIEKNLNLQINVGQIKQIVIFTITS